MAESVMQAASVRLRILFNIVVSSPFLFRFYRRPGGRRNSARNILSHLCVEFKKILRKGRKPPVVLS